MLERKNKGSFLNENKKSPLGVHMKTINSIKKKLRKSKKKREFIETTITIKTKDLLSENKRMFQKNNFSLILSLFTALVSSITILIKYKPDFTNFFGENNVMFLLGIIIVVLILVNALFMIFRSDVKKFTNKIIQNQYDVQEYTAIFLIKMVFDNTPKILVSKSSIWKSYMLPYCHYNPLDDARVPTDDMKRAIAEYLEVPINSFKVDTYYDNEHISIKRNMSHNNISRINYRFYYVTFTDSFVKNHLILNKVNHNLIWKSKDELMQDSPTQLNNGDVILAVDEMGLINQTPVAFEESYKTSYELRNKYRIIWNITNECFYECPMCATNSSKNEHCVTTIEEKQKILMSIASINKNIEKLDISGGDPLKSKDDQKVIKMANRILPFANISVTTTGQGLNNVDLSEFTDIIKTCDITYDIPYKQCLLSCREYDYNLSNIRKIEGMRKAGLNVDFNIHVPIHKETINKDIVYNILYDLKDIKPKEVKFIRLMPVGRAADKIDESYDPSKFLGYVNECKKELAIDFKTSLNCSLRVRSVNANNQAQHKCKMLEEKIGIDHKGNVFTCIWGAYIETKSGKIEDNPFYIGNCLKEPLCDILTSKYSIKYFTNNSFNGKPVLENGNYCRVCAYAKNQSINIEGNDGYDGLRTFVFDE